MKMIHRDRLDVSALAGIALGWALLLPVFFVPELGLLAVPALAVLMTSLLFCAR